MRLLITGGFGYLGGRLAQYCASKMGCEILLGSRTQVESPPWLKEARVVQTFWSSPAELEESCAGVDAVVHMAGANASDCAADPVGALVTNGVGTACLLEASIRQGVKRFIYLSTAHVYGNPLMGEISEKTPPSTNHPYATSHLAGEAAVQYKHQQGEIFGLTIRLSNTFGAPAHKDANCWMLLANDLCWQAVTKQKMVLRSSGMQRRDFIPLTDVCGAIHHLLHLAEKDIYKNVFNLGGAWAPTVWDFACLVQERCKVVLGFEPSLSRLAQEAGKADHNFDYCIDALLQTGFSPEFNRVSEIDQLLDFCQEVSFSPNDN